MAKFNVPSAPTVNAFVINEPGGVDFWNSPDNVSKNRSPMCVNMIRDKNGSMRKRMGYRKLIDEPFESRINGGCFFANKHFIHSGKTLYALDKNGEVSIWAYNLEDEKSLFIPTVEKLYVLSGKAIYFITNDAIGQIKYWAYIPTVIVSKSPSGGGTVHEDYNLISDIWKEQFLADGESTVYKLEKKDIDLVISVRIRDENGDWQELDRKEFSENKEAGEVIFKVPPPKPSVVGMDNVIIEVSRDEESKDMIYGCTVGTVFGTNGVDDRLFLGGNPDYPGMDFFSAAGDFSYFPHTNFSKISIGDIKGYSVYNGSLYTHLSNGNLVGKSTMVKRNSATLENGKETFVITEEFFAPEYVSRNSSCTLNGEPLFLSRNGIYGVTISDVTKEKVCELRSAYLGKVFSELSYEELKNAQAVVIDDFYMLSLNGKMFILDGGKKSYFSGTPLCSFQYECYYWENIPARIIWTDGSNLYFGDENGMIYCFFTDKDAKESYYDDGKSVVCSFETSDIDDRQFFKRKTYISVSAKIGAFFNTGIKIYAKRDGVWGEKPIYDSGGKGKNFRFSALEFSCLGFFANRNSVSLCGKVRIRNTNSVRFKITNDKAEPFVLYSFGAEYVQKGNNYK